MKNLKKKKELRLLSLLICAAAVSLSFAGCSDENIEKDAEAPAAETAAVTETVTEAETEAPAAEEKSASADEETPAFDFSGVSTFELSSESIADGVWNSVITNTAKGSSVSPQLSWEPVENADGYAVYMIDTSAKNWMHWKSADVKETTLAEGWADKTEYVGPYPPGGTHTYDVYVFALRNSLKEISGNFDASNDNFMSNWQDITTSLDSPDGTPGNIISYGYLSGTYTAGE